MAQLEQTRAQQQAELTRVTADLQRLASLPAEVQRLNTERQNIQRTLNQTNQQLTASQQSVQNLNRELQQQRNETQRATQDAQSKQRTIKSLQQQLQTHNSFIQVFIRNLVKGKTEQYLLSPDMTVGQLKQALAPSKETAAGSLRITFNGKETQDALTLQQSGVYADCTLVCQIRTSGG